MKDPWLSKSGVSFERLRSFCSIVEAGSVVGAADRDPNKQSQFSRQIKDLERALAVKLFRREGKRLILTAAGVRLAAITEGYFAGLQELQEEVAERIRPLSIGAGESAIRWILLPRLNDVLAAAGNGSVEFRGLRTNETVAMLKDGELDVGIVRSDALDDDLEAQKLCSQRFVLMVPRALLPEKSSAGIKHLSSLPVAMLSGDGKFVQTAERVAKQNGLTLNTRVRVESFSFVLYAARSLEIAAFVPEQAQGELPADRFTKVDIPAMELLDRDLSIAVNRHSAAVRDRPRRFVQRFARVMGG